MQIHGGMGYMKELDIERFYADHRSDAVPSRVRRDLSSGVRAGVVSTPTILLAGEMHAGRIDPGVLDALL